MRKVKIISTANIPKAFTLTNDFEAPINEILEKIDNINGEIVKTEYCISHQGTLNAVIIEYEVL